MIVNDTVFVHAGLSFKYAQFGLEKINQQTRSWILGKTKKPDFLDGADSPIWSRRFSTEYISSYERKELKEMLFYIDCKRMVVGHTIQFTGIQSLHDDQVWLIDTGMSQCYGGPLQALEINKNGVINILKADS